MKRVVRFVVLLLGLWLCADSGWSDDDLERRESAKRDERYVAALEARNKALDRSLDAAKKRNEDFVFGERIEALSLALAVLAGLTVSGLLVGRAINSASGRIADAIRQRTGA